MARTPSSGTTVNPRVRGGTGMYDRLTKLPNGEPARARRNPTNNVVDFVLVR